jgi:hypothetical protein
MGTKDLKRAEKLASKRDAMNSSHITVPNQFE